MSISLAFYKADASYCDYLRQYDGRVPYTYDDKAKRPFIGVVIEHEGLKRKYYIPLTSPKPKHMAMKNNLDFHKINGGIWGALNFNNMIPVTDDAIVKIDPAQLPVETKEDLNYKYLIENQLSWCNSNKDLIINKAIKLHDLIVEGKAPENIAKRCCSYMVLEQASMEWSKSHAYPDIPKDDNNDGTWKSLDDRIKDAKAYKDDKRDGINIFAHIPKNKVDFER